MWTAPERPLQDERASTPLRESGVDVAEGLRALVLVAALVTLCL